MTYSNLKYQSGFGNEFASETLPGALPEGCNNPQRAPYNLYAEQLSGTAFTAPVSENQRSWLYRILPSVLQKPFEILTLNNFSNEKNKLTNNPNQLRWDAPEISKTPQNFLQGLQLVCASGTPQSRSGSAIYLYTCNTSMSEEYFYNSDGDFLIVPQSGKLLLHTEFGKMTLESLEIAVIPRGIKFQVELLEKTARGYVCENFGLALQLPDRGPIGANGLANARDFLTPVAAYEEKNGNFKLITKFLGSFWQADISHSPLDVVAWHGNYVPYKYHLKYFNTINTVSFDHPDPSIFTVLTSPSGHAGTANIDFVIFPPRWMVAEKTFRPPWYHRNLMSEYMGLITGQYDAKPTGFVPGGGSLHNCMSAHGPDKESFEHATKQDLKPDYQSNTMAFMFESRAVYQPTQWALETPLLQKDYFECWQGLVPYFAKELNRAE